MARSKNGPFLFLSFATGNYSDFLCEDRIDNASGRCIFQQTPALYLWLKDVNYIVSVRLKPLRPHEVPHGLWLTLAIRRNYVC
jgi:hypothetical protein